MGGKCKDLERRKQYEKEYRKKHKEHYDEYFKNYRETHREAERERTLRFYYENTKFRQKLIHNSLIAMLGGKCGKCDSKENLEIDHILGGGIAERRFKFSNSNHMMYRYYLANPKKAKYALQVLCRIHNQEKKILMKEFRGTYEKKWNSYYQHNR